MTQTAFDFARSVRRQVLRACTRARTAHLASSLSCVDILTAAYGGILRIDPSNPRDPERDRFILSKGHAVCALYATLSQAGFFDPAELEHYNEDGGHLPEQPSPGCMPGVELATGSLGHGLGVGLGQALGARIQGKKFRVFVLLSDGECNEGSVWEAALLAPAQRLDNLVAIVDYNKWQATGRSQQITALDPLADKWRAFGWETVEVDGHDVEAIANELRIEPDGQGKPKAIIAHTVKGKGVSFMEDDNNWHYRIPTATELSSALQELGFDS